MPTCDSPVSRSLLGARTTPPGPISVPIDMLVGTLAP